jgi:glycosyltransferase involved in cell wall biosynthesis
MKEFSVILPVTNSILLEEILAALRNQSYDLNKGEILVIGPHPTMPMDSDHRFRFIPINEQQTCASDKRNIGIQEALGAVYLFLDDDCIPYPDWIERHMAWQNKGKKIIGGAVHLPEDNYIQLADNLSAFHFMTEFTSEGYRLYLCTANLSVERSVVEACGLMEPNRNRAEDLEWTARFRMHGYDLYFDPLTLICHNPNRRSWKDFWRHWWDDAPHTLTIRLRYRYLLQTPKFAGRRCLYLWTSPWIAWWATMRTFSNRQYRLRYIHTLPIVYVSKLIWCWSAFWNFPHRTK